MMRTIQPQGIIYSCNPNPDFQQQVEELAQSIPLVIISNKEKTTTVDAINQDNTVVGQNAKGRYVYLPEEMMFVKFLPDGTISQEILEKGHHYVEVALNEVPLFIRKGKAIPVADVAQTVKDINPATIRMIGYEGAEYDRYDDDGVSAL